MNTPALIAMGILLGLFAATWLFSALAVTYKVMYHSGESIGLSTKVATGRLSLANGRIEIVGTPAVSIPVQALHGVKLFRLHKVGRMLKINHQEGTLFVSVVWFCLFGRFAIVNFFGTGFLLKSLRAARAATKAVNPPAPNPNATAESS
jgi:hypothetical protein